MLKCIHCIFQLLKALSPQLQVLKNTSNSKHDKCFGLIDVLVNNFSSWVRFL